MKSFYLYILKCSDDSYYVGHTDDIEQRIDEHYRGENHCYTSSRRPLKLVYVTEFAERDEAFDAERQIKKWTRKKKEALIREDWYELQKLAKKKFKKS